MYSGVYVVCLTMWDSLGNCQSSFCDSVTITNVPPPPCNASFTYGFQANTFYFSDQSTGGPFVSWSWNFGDGNTSSLQSPSHSYANAGTYAVCLAVISQTDTCSYCDTVNYSPCTLQASFSSNTSTDPSVSFTNTSSGGNPPLMYSWSFGDGNYSSTSNPLHTYQYNGTYLVCLTVYEDSLNNPGCYNIYCDSISINNAPTPPCDSAFTAYVDSSGSGWAWFYPNGNNNVSCSWNFGDGNFGTGCSQAGHQYSVTGTYYICLTVTDANGNTCTGCDSVYVYRLGSGIDEQNGNVFGIKNHPNPFTSSTMISYSLKKKSEVTVSVFSHAGIKIAELENENKESGNHQLEWNAGNVTPGIYFLEIKSGESVLLRKMVLIK